MKENWLGGKEEGAWERIGRDQVWLGCFESSRGMRESQKLEGTSTDWDERNFTIRLWKRGWIYKTVQTIRHP